METVTLELTPAEVAHIAQLMQVGANKAIEDIVKTTEAILPKLQAALPQPQADDEQEAPTPTP